MADFVTGHDGPVLVASHDRAFLDAGGHRRRRARPAPAADRLLHRRLVRLRGGARARPPPGARGLRGVRRHARPPRSHSRGSGPTGRPRDCGTSRAGTSRTSTSARSSRPGPTARPARAARVKRSVDRLEEVAQPRKEWELRYAIRRRRSVGRRRLAPSTGSRSSAATSASDRSTSPSPAATGWRWPAATAAGKTTLLAAVLGDVPLSGGRVSVGSRVRLGVIDQQRSLLETDASVVDVVRTELGDPDRGDGADPAGEVRPRRRARRPAGPEPVHGRAHPGPDGGLPGP